MRLAATRVLVHGGSGLIYGGRVLVHGGGIGRGKRRVGLGARHRRVDGVARRSARGGGEVSLRMRVSVLDVRVRVLGVVVRVLDMRVRGNLSLVERHGLRSTRLLGGVKVSVRSRLTDEEPPAGYLLPGSSPEKSGGTRGNHREKHRTDRPSVERVCSCAGVTLRARIALRSGIALWPGVSLWPRIALRSRSTRLTSRASFTLDSLVPGVALVSLRPLRADFSLWTRIALRAGFSRITLGSGIALRTLGANTAFAVDDTLRDCCKSRVIANPVNDLSDIFERCRPAESCKGFLCAFREIHTATSTKAAAHQSG